MAERVLSAIREFSGEYFFLSNFDRSPLFLHGHLYVTGEHAFQAQKTLSPFKRRKIQGASTPRLAKIYGRDVELREDWDDIKDRVMTQVIHAKFPQGSALALRLLRTGDRDLVEGNTWGDTYWGVNVATGHGKNKLGTILMSRRSQLG